MRFIARSAAALLTTALIVGGTTTAAHAQSQTIKDKKGDVVQYDGFEDERGTVLSTNQSAKSGVDVRSMKVNHKKKSVVLDVKFSQLKKNALLSVVFRVNGKSRESYYMVSTSRSRADVYDRKDRRVCSAKLKTRLGKKGSIKATLKRSCLDNPKKLKVSAASVSIENVETDSEQPVFLADVVSKSSVRNPAWSKWLKAG